MAGGDGGKGGKGGKGKKTQGGTGKGHGARDSGDDWGKWNSSNGYQGDKQLGEASSWASASDVEMWGGPWQTVHGGSSSGSWWTSDWKDHGGQWHSQSYKGDWEKEPKKYRSNDWAGDDEPYNQPGYSFTGPQAQDPHYEIALEEPKEVINKLPQPITELPADSDEEGDTKKWWGARAEFGRCIPCDACDCVYGVPHAMVQCYFSNGHVPNIAGAGRRIAKAKE